MTLYLTGYSLILIYINTHNHLQKVFSDEIESKNLIFSTKKYNHVVMESMSATSRSSRFQNSSRSFLFNTAPSTGSKDIAILVVWFCIFFVSGRLFFVTEVRIEHSIDFTTLKVKKQCRYVTLQCIYLIHLSYTFTCNFQTHRQENIDFYI